MARPATRWKRTWTPGAAGSDRARPAADAVPGRVQTLPGMALVAGLPGLAGTAEGPATIAQGIFADFLVLFLVALFVRSRRGGTPPP